MNVLFLSLIDFQDIDEHNIYSDLLREFWKNGHQLYIVSPVEKRSGRKAGVIKSDQATIVKPRVFDIQKVGYVKKAFSMLTIEPILKRVIKKELDGIRFDLVLYATPPITFEGVVSYVKRRDGALTYLLQKDIVPESLLDLQVLTERGLKGLIYKYYRSKEVRLFKASDWIGCMSQANIDFIRAHNSYLDPARVELCPNSIEIVDKSVDADTRERIRRQYGIPQDKRVFVYGGNLGKPQGVSFLIECLKECEDTDAYFLIVGDGTEYPIIESYVDNYSPSNVRLMKSLPKDDYDAMVGACDVGMIFLDHRFTVPNFPSRLLSYMQAKLPVLAVTDPYTDIGKMIVDGEYGWWCESNNVNAFKKIVIMSAEAPNAELGERAFKCLKELYDVRDAYKCICDKMN